MNIVLIGFMGSGKSAVGRALSRQWGAGFLDTDAEIEREAGKPISRIFAEEGEEAFRRAETALLARLASSADLPSGGMRGAFVLATGGGTPLREENAHLLKQIGPLVWLTASADTILERVRRNLPQRPLLAGSLQDPRTRIAGLLAARAPYYEALADYRIDHSPLATPDAVAAQIIALLRLNEAQCVSEPAKNQR